jgi:hypothetical protein
MMLTEAAAPLRPRVVPFEDEIVGESERNFVADFRFCRSDLLRERRNGPEQRLFAAAKERKTIVGLQAEPVEQAVCRWQ